MKTVSIIFAMLLVFVAVTGADGGERFPWLTDLDEARALAAAEDKPLLVVFRCEP